MRHETAFILIILAALASAGMLFNGPADCAENAMEQGYLDTPTVIPPTWTPTPLPLCLHHGDVDFNGSLTAGDSQQVFFYVLGFQEPGYLESCAADCDGNELITAGDSQTIFESVLSLDNCVDPLP